MLPGGTQLPRRRRQAAQRTVHRAEPRRSAGRGEIKMPVVQALAENSAGSAANERLWLLPVYTLYRDGVAVPLTDLCGDLCGDSRSSSGSGAAAPVAPVAPAAAPPAAPPADEPERADSPPTPTPSPELPAEVPAEIPLAQAHPSPGGESPVAQVVHDKLPAQPESDFPKVRH